MSPGRAVSAFRERFAAQPRWAASAPGRVNLIGEHTDYNDGFVLPMAIDRRCFIAAAPAANPAVSRLFAADLRETTELDWRSPGALAPGPAWRGTWPAYVAGVIGEFQFLHRGAIPNLDIAIASDVPIGGGLSSSAAAEVATATLIEQITGLILDPRAKALLCQRAEHEYAGVPCGIMDQFISVMGRENHALLIDCRSQEATPIPMPGPDRLAVLVFDTGVRHALASGEYARRRATCETAAAKLGLRSLRDAKLDALDRHPLTPEELRRARHVITENTRTLQAAEALRRGDLATMGRLLGASHASLRDDYEVSCPELDTIVDLAGRCPGVYGARMTGGGFGGCAIAMCRPEATGDATANVRAGYTRAFNRACTIWPVAASSGAAASRSDAS